MSLKIPLQYLLLGCVAMLCLCGKARPKEQRYGSDSLSMGKLRALMAPDASLDDSVMVRQTLFRYALAKYFSKQPPVVDSVSAKLARRMTLQSGREWSPEAASLLLNAVSALAARVRIAKDSAEVIRFVDSVFATSDPVQSGKRPGLKIDFTGLRTRDLRDAEVFKRIVSSVFGVSVEEAATLVSFIGRDLSGTAEAPAANIDKMVRGILTKQTPRSPVVAHENVAADSAVRALAEEKSRAALLALKFRPQESIRDSIARHQRVLEGIYKKQLKLNERSGGLVWVVFAVRPDGSVLSAKIKSSAIANRQFQQALEEYVRTIRFKAIPKDMEPMIFEFPFEFKPEG
jgi:TonB family protein